MKRVVNDEKHDFLKNNNEETFDFKGYSVGEQNLIGNEQKAKRSGCFYLGVGMVVVSVVSIALILRTMSKVTGEVVEGSNQLRQRTNNPPAEAMLAIFPIIFLAMVLQVAVPVIVVLLLLTCVACCCMYKGRKKIRVD